MLSGDALADALWTDMRRRSYLQGFPRLRSERTVSVGYCFRIMVFPFPALRRKCFKLDQHGPAVTDQFKCQSNASAATARRRNSKMFAQKKCQNGRACKTTMPSKQRYTDIRLTYNQLVSMRHPSGPEGDNAERERRAHRTGCRDS